MDYEMASILKVMAEMDAFSEMNDDLSRWIDSYDDGELAEDDLSLVSAAHAAPPFSDFLKRRL